MFVYRGKPHKVSRAKDPQGMGASSLALDRTYALTLALIALDDDRVNEVLVGLGIELHDDQGEKIFPAALDEADCPYIGTRISDLPPQAKTVRCVCERRVALVDGAIGPHKAGRAFADQLRARMSKMRRELSEKEVQADMVRPTIEIAKDLKDLPPADQVLGAEKKLRGGE